MMSQADIQVLPGRTFPPCNLLITENNQENMYYAQIKKSILPFLPDGI